MHCLASTGSSLKHSTRVLVLVIAEYFTDTEYTPLQALRQGAAACCFFMPAYCIKRTEKRAESSGKLPETVKTMPRKLVDKKA